jgi:protein TonB
VILPSAEQVADADAMLVPLPAIITERPLVPTSASSAAAPSARSVGTRRPARPLQRSAPDYPSALRAAKIAGTVGVTFTVDKTGRPTNVHARSGPPPLRAVAEAAIQQWRYEPATLDDVAVDSEMTVQFTFGPTNAPRPE